MKNNKRVSFFNNDVEDHDRIDGIEQQVGQLLENHHLLSNRVTHVEQSVQVIQEEQRELYIVTATLKNGLATLETHMTKQFAEIQRSSYKDAFIAIALVCCALLFVLLIFG